MHSSPSRREFALREKILWERSQLACTGVLCLASCGSVLPSFLTVWDSGTVILKIYKLHVRRTLKERHGTLIYLSWYTLSYAVSRRSRSPLGGPQRGGTRRLTDPRSKKQRNMSMESVGSDTKDLESLKLNNKKYTEEIARIGADLAYVREQVAVSLLFRCLHSIDDCNRFK